MLDVADQLSAAPRLRLVPYAYAEAYGRRPAALFQAPGGVTLLGGEDDQDGAFAAAVPWGAIVAAEPSADAAVELRAMNHPTEPLEIPLSAVTPHGRYPAWAAGALGAVHAVRERCPQMPGVTLLVHTDLPAGSGAAATTATGCAVALAVRELYAPELPAAELAQAVAESQRLFAGADEGGNEGAAVAAAALLGRAEAAVYRDSESASWRSRPLDLAAADARLLIIDSRTRRPAEASRTREPLRPAQPEPLPRPGDLARLGALITAGHDRLRERGHSSPEQDTAVRACLAGGAFGARMLRDGRGRPAVALVPAAAVGAVRSAVRDAFGQLGWRPPRFLTATPAAGARRAA